MDFSCFKLDFKQDYILIELTRPKVMNAIDSTLLQELEELLNYLKEKKTKVAVIYGTGRAFIAGADISEMADFGPKEAEEFSLNGNKIFQMLEDHPTIFIAAINGFALGGGLELALACDLRLASSEAVFGQPEINLGIIPGFGGTQRLARVIGLAKAKEWIFSGEHVQAAQALEFGLVNEVTESEDLLAKAEELAEKISQKSGPILTLAKEAINSSGVAITKEAGVKEAEFFQACFKTNDAKEGLKAFLEKRRPEFKNE